METQTAIRVKIAPLMDELKIVDVQPGTTIRETFGKAGISMKTAQDILLDEEPVDLDAILDRDCVITLLPKVEAGRN